MMNVIDPLKQGVGRQRGSTKAQQEIAGPATLKSAHVEREDGAALEPAGPAPDNAQAETAPRTRRGRAASGSQATVAAAAAEGDSLQAAAQDTAQVQTEAPKKKRGRSGASTATTKQVLLTEHR